MHSLDASTLGSIINSLQELKENNGHVETWLGIEDLVDAESLPVDPLVSARAKDILYRLRDTHHRLESVVSAIDHTANELRGFAMPSILHYGINSLPPEILSLIAKYTRTPLRRPSPTFPLVCRRFREIELHTPEMWAFVNGNMSTERIALQIKRAKGSDMAFELIEGGADYWGCDCRYRCRCDVWAAFAEHAERWTSGRVVLWRGAILKSTDHLFGCFDYAIWCSERVRSKREVDHEGSARDGISDSEPDAPGTVEVAGATGLADTADASDATVEENVTEENEIEITSDTHDTIGAGVVMDTTAAVEGMEEEDLAEPDNANDSDSDAETDRPLSTRMHICIDKLLRVSMPVLRSLDLDLRDNFGFSFIRSWSTPGLQNLIWREDLSCIPKATVLPVSDDVRLKSLKLKLEMWDRGLDNGEGGGAAKALEWVADVLRAQSVEDLTRLELVFVGKTWNVVIPEEDLPSKSSICPPSGPKFGSLDELRFLTVTLPAPGLLSQRPSAAAVALKVQTISLLLTLLPNILHLAPNINTYTLTADCALVEQVEFWSYMSFLRCYCANLEELRVIFLRPPAMMGDVGERKLASDIACCVRGSQEPPTRLADWWESRLKSFDRDLEHHAGFARNTTIGPPRPSIIPPSADDSVIRITVVFRDDPPPEFPDDYLCKSVGFDEETEEEADYYRNPPFGVKRKSFDREIVEIVQLN